MSVTEAGGTCVQSLWLFELEGLVIVYCSDYVMYSCCCWRDVFDRLDDWCWLSTYVQWTCQWVRKDGKWSGQILGHWGQFWM